MPRIGVVGGGAMGTGIALGYAVAGWDVVVRTRSQGSGERALRQIGRDLDLMVETGLLAADAARTALGRIRTTTGLDEVTDGVDHVVESIPENVALKQELFAELDRRTPAGVLLCTNTTALPITPIAAGCAHPERVLATHFYLPAHLIPLVDVVPGERTSREAVERATTMLTELGKEPVVFGVDAGATVGPRLQTALVAEALKVVAEGVADPLTVDRVITKGIGRRFGVTGAFDRLDLAGLDTMVSVMQSQGRPVPAAVAEKVDAGHVGRRSGRGFYDWSPERSAAFDERVARHLIAQLPAGDQRPAVLLPQALLTEFVSAATEEYDACTPAEPPSCFALLAGEPTADGWRVRRLHFAKNVREDPDVDAEFAEHIVPCFGAAYANKRRGFWADGADVLAAHRSAEAEGLELLGSIHLHPDWHRIGPPDEQSLRISQRPTPMDAHVFRRTGWPLNLILYLERLDGELFSALGAWTSPSSDQSPCAELDVRLGA